MKIFVASNFENAEAARELEDVLRAEGYEVISTWTSQKPLTDIAMAPVHSMDDLEELNEADVLVVLWPGKQGTITEFGYAMGTNKPVILHGQVPYERGVLGGNIHFHHPSVTRTETLDRLLEVLAFRKEYIYYVH